MQRRSFHESDPPASIVQCRKVGLTSGSPSTASIRTRRLNPAHRFHELITIRNHSTGCQRSESILGKNSSVFRETSCPTRFCRDILLTDFWGNELRSADATTESVKNRRFRRMWLDASMVVSFAGFVLLASSRVDATCGDYLVHGSMTSDNALSILPEIDGDFAVQTFDTSGLPQPRRCHGPMCQQGPRQLPLSTPIILIDAQDRWFRNIEFLMPVQCDASFIPHRREPLESGAFVFRLERPPKI